MSYNFTYNGGSIHVQWSHSFSGLPTTAHFRKKYASREQKTEVIANIQRITIQISINSY